MDLKKCAIATLAVGVLANVYDFVVHGAILSKFIYERMTSFLNQDASMTSLVIADFVAAAVFVCVYDQVRTSFDAGLKGGLTFGLFAGVLINFPTWIIAHVVISGLTYELAWVWTISGVVWCLIAGAVAAVVYQRVG